MSASSTGPKRPRGLGTRALAYAVWISTAVDKLYLLFDRVRSRFVTGIASDAFYDAYNDAAYGHRKAYIADDPAARRGFFEWEREAVARYFPAAPATVLIGGAGGGREALAFAAIGYAVSAFDPARPLIASMARASQSLGLDARVEPLVGRFEDLPTLATEGGAPVDLLGRQPFDAAVVGWGSLSHVRSEASAAGVIRQLAALSEGPILVSYIPAPGTRHDPRAVRGSFNPQIGFFYTFTADDIRALAERAGVSIVALMHNDGNPYVILRRERPSEHTSGVVGSRP